MPRPLHGTSSPGSPKNGIPLWIAGGGERKTLRIAAEYADYTNFDGSPEGFAAKSAILAAHCADVGRDFGTIVRSANYNVVIAEDDAGVQRRLEAIREQYRSAGLTGDRLESTVASFASGPLVGTPEQIVAALSELADLGMSYAITYFVEAAYDLTGIELFERAVIPAMVAATEHPERRHHWHLPGRD